MDNRAKNMSNIALSNVQPEPKWTQVYNGYS